jgi:hypothetical protein
MTEGVVSTQSYQRSGRARRWGYVLDIPGEWAYVSEYRYGSEAAARAAGEKDLAGSLKSGPGPADEKS